MHHPKLASSSPIGGQDDNLKKIPPPEATQPPASDGALEVAEKYLSIRMSDPPDCDLRESAKELAGHLRAYSKGSGACRESPGERGADSGGSDKVVPGDLQPASQGESAAGCAWAIGGVLPHVANEKWQSALKEFYSLERQAASRRRM